MARRATSSQPRLDAAFVRDYAHQYVAAMRPLETELLEKVGPEIATRGHLTAEELTRIGSWKSARATGYLGRNDPEDVIDITRLALSAGTPDRLRHRVLMVLQGVGRPIASAVLTVWQPDRYTVIDVYAVAALHALGRLDAAEVGGVGFPEYLQACRAVVEELGDGITLRDLDRALWMWWSVRRRSVETRDSSKRDP